MSHKRAHGKALPKATLKSRIREITGYDIMKKVQKE
jgi:hypothetical protein